jgi:hypothetical protein
VTQKSYRKYIEFVALCLLASALLWWFGRNLDWREVGHRVGTANLLPNLSPVQISSKPPEKSPCQQTENDELDIFAITFLGHRRNHNILGRFDRLLQLTDDGKNPVRCGPLICDSTKAGYTDNPEL